MATSDKKHIHTSTSASFSSFLHRGTQLVVSGKAIFVSSYHWIANVINNAPLRTFFVLLGLLFLCIVAGNYVRKPTPEIKTTIPAKEVRAYRIGTAPTVTMQAQIDKSGVVTITSLTNGVVGTIYANEGHIARAGSWLIGLTTTYQGGNTYSISRQMAEKQNKLTEDTYPMQRELIGKQRDLANKNETNAEKLREITNASIGETQSSIDLNTDIINTLDSNLADLIASTSANQSLILGTKQLKSQFLGANNQLKNAIRQSQYQADSANPPASLATLSRDVALKQLEIQEKTLDLNREISKLQLTLARISEGLMYPSAPFEGVVERVFVRPGQAVNPGTPLVVLSGSKTKNATATVFAPAAIAKNISQIEKTKLHIGKKIIEQYPTFVSNEATNGTLYSIVFSLPEEAYEGITDKGFVTAELPVGYADTGSSIPFVPIDSVYQTRESAYVFIAKDGAVKNAPVTLGDVYGRYVRVLSGIKTGDSVILDRSVIDGESVIVAQ
jgi:multidrug efflux pump subunit AcrA (membrane-fusion protein)